LINKTLTKPSRYFAERCGVQMPENMKTANIFVTLGLIWSIVTTAQAQKFGYIDSEYITAKMPEYQKLSGEFDQVVARWTKEIGDKQQALDKLDRAYRAEEVLLTEEMKKQRLSDISEKEKDIRTFQNQVFGLNGLMFQKKKEMMKPILDEIGKAIEKIARQKQLMFLFDKASDGMAMIYTDPRHDYTDYVLEELGISVEQLKEKEKEEAENAATPAPSSTPKTKKKN
jgi:outer membrane protein